MSTAAEWLERAHAQSDPQRADQFAVFAIAKAPTLPEPYLLRARLATQRAELGVACFHLRQAFARGARDAWTVHMLSLCLEVAGRAEVAQRMLKGAPLLAPVEALRPVALRQQEQIVQIFAQAQPNPGQAGLLPGETLPGPVGPKPAPPPSPAPAPAAPQAASAEPASAEPAPIEPTGPTANPPAPSEPVSAGPAPSEPAPPRSSGPPPRPAAASAPPAKIVITPLAQPQWLESTPVFEQSAARPTAQPAWLESGTLPASASASRGAPAAYPSLELSFDPGPATVIARSPVTGEAVQLHELDRQSQGARMPEIGPRLGPLDALDAFAGQGDLDLKMALDLPGPLLLRPQQPPRQLARAVAVGLNATQLIFRDRALPSAPLQRVNLSDFRQASFDAARQQLDLSWPDGRCLRLDLSALQRDAPTLAGRFVHQLLSGVRGHKT